MDTSAGKSLGRNEPCPCGSGRKYKHCCLDKDEAAAREARAKAQAEAAAAPEKPEKTKSGRPHGRKNHDQSFGGAHADSRGFHKTTGTRKVGGG